MKKKMKITHNSYISKEICSIFSESLNRIPSNEELDYYISQLQEGRINISDVSKLTESSDEYTFLSKNKDAISEILKYNYKILKEELKKQSKLKTPKAIFYVDVKKISYKNNPSTTERFIEYFWVLKNLQTKGNLLDIGCTESLFANEVSKIKSLDVYGIDIRNEQNPSYKFFVEDATKTHFEDHFFDQITIISSIEHFGLDFYGNKKINPTADLDSMKEIKRILKKDGTLFLTTPYGKNGTSWYRKYNKNSLKKLFDGFQIIKVKYFCQTKKGWIETEKDHAEIIGHAKIHFGSEPFPGAIVAIMATLK